jgi:hypothetical protein
LPLVCSTSGPTLGIFLLPSQTHLVVIFSLAFESHSAASDVLRELFKTTEIPMACQPLWQSFSIAFLRSIPVRTAQKKSKIGTPETRTRSTQLLNFKINCSGLGLASGLPISFRLPTTIKRLDCAPSFPQPAARGQPTDPDKATQSCRGAKQCFCYLPRVQHLAVAGKFTGHIAKSMPACNWFRVPAHATASNPQPVSILCKPEEKTANPLYAKASPISK